MLSESAQMWSGCPKARVRFWTELGGGGSSKKYNPESLKDRDNWVVAHPLQTVPKQWWGERWHECAPERWRGCVQESPDFKSWRVSN